MIEFGPNPGYKAEVRTVAVSKPHLSIINHPTLGRLWLAEYRRRQAFGLSLYEASQRVRFLALTAHRRLPGYVTATAEEDFLMRHSREWRPANLQTRFAPSASVAVLQTPWHLDNPLGDLGQSDEACRRASERRELERRMNPPGWDLLP